MEQALCWFFIGLYRIDAIALDKQDPGFLVGIDSYFDPADG